MQMEYRDCVINLLDTPGHQDFSEDTYRVLTAVDAALMVIDAANGVEPQTRRLLQVCRARNTPILTFVNKMDREVQEPLALMDEIERELGMSVVPFTWPIGMGKAFHGVMDLREQRMRVFPPGEDRAASADEVLEGLDNPRYAERFGAEYEHAKDDIELVQTAAPVVRPRRLPGRPADADVLRLGHQQLRRAGGARRAASSWRRRPTRATTMQRTVKPEERQASPACVFKIQANMDPAHRDRIAFVRVASGHFERGMRLKVVRSGKELRPNTVVSFLSQRRELLDEAFAGDIIGIPNHGVLQLGDTLTEGESPAVHRPALLRARDVPHRRSGRPAAHQAAARRTHPARRGRRDPGVPADRRLVLLLGAVGQLQFEVVAHRLEHEYGVKARVQASRFSSPAG